MKVKYSAITDCRRRSIDPMKDAFELEEDLGTEEPDSHPSLTSSTCTCTRTMFIRRKKPRKGK